MTRRSWELWLGILHRLPWITDACSSAAWNSWWNFWNLVQCLLILEACHSSSVQSSQVKTGLIHVVAVLIDLGLWLSLVARNVWIGPRLHLVSRLEAINLLNWLCVYLSHALNWWVDCRWAFFVAHAVDVVLDHNWLHCLLGLSIRRVLNQRYWFDGYILGFPYGFVVTVLYICFRALDSATVLRSYSLVLLV